MTWVDEPTGTRLGMCIERVARRLAEIEPAGRIDVTARWALAELGDAAGVTDSLECVRRGVKCGGGIRKKRERQNEQKR